MLNGFFLSVITWVNYQLCCLDPVYNHNHNHNHIKRIVAFINKNYNSLVSRVLLSMRRVNNGLPCGSLRRMRETNNHQIGALHDLWMLYT